MALRIRKNGQAVQDKIKSWTPEDERLAGLTDPLQEDTLPKKAEPDRVWQAINNPGSILHNVDLDKIDTDLIQNILDAAPTTRVRSSAQLTKPEPPRHWWLHKTRRRSCKSR